MTKVILVCAAMALGSMPGEEAYLAGHDAEQAGRYADAITSYRECAEQDEDLAPYAEIRIASCRARSGQSGGAIAALREALERRPDGPWVRMAQARMAQLLANEKRHADAKGFFSRALDVALMPWWMEPYAWAAGENLLADQSTRAEGYAFFRQVVDTTAYLGPRRDAARRLLPSPGPGDRALAVLGLLRAGMYSDAGKALLTSSSSIIDTSGAPLLPANVGARLFQPWPNEAQEAKTLDAWVQANAGNLWMRLWLIYAMRKQVNNHRLKESEEICALLVKHFQSTREAGEALWWLARHFEREDKDKAAAALFQQLVRDCPAHYRADDALSKAARWHHRERNYTEAERLFVKLAQDYPESPFRSHAYYTCARIQAKARDGEDARPNYLHAVEAGAGDFYAHRALDRLGGGPAGTGAAEHNLKIDGKHPILRPFPGMMEDVTPLPQAILDEARIKRLFFFGAHGLEAGEWEALHLCMCLKDCKEPSPYYRALAEAGYLHMALEHADARGWGMKDGPSGAGPAGDARTIERLRFEFPLVFWPSLSAVAKEAGVDPLLLLAMAKQESTFRARVSSQAGAQGLMQVMPATAHWLAKVEPNVTAAHVRSLQSPSNSIRLGAYYLLRMIDGSDGNLVYALASYNAGPGNCRKWRKRFPNYDVDRFIEAIPFGETQRYVTAVLGYYAAYHSLYPTARN